jgi:opacity protein-like surface antigen
MPRTSQRIPCLSLAFTVLFVAAAAGSASAQYSSRFLELSGFGGYYVASDLYRSFGTGGGADIGLENSPMYGGRIGIYPSVRGGIEFAYARTGSDVTIKNGSTGFNPGELGRLDLSNYDINFVISQPNLANPNVEGFFTLGFGWIVTDPNLSSAGPTPPPAGSEASGETFFAWNLGLGTKIALSQKLWLRLEGRWKTADTNVTTSSGVYCDYWGYCYQYASDWYNSGEFTGGLTFRFGS